MLFLLSGDILGEWAFSGLLQHNMETCSLFCYLSRVTPYMLGVVMIKSLERTR